MSQTISIKVNNKKTLKLIQDLESLNLLEIIKGKVSKKRSKNLSVCLIGCAASSDVEDVLNELNETRDGWNRI